MKSKNIFNIITNLIFPPRCLNCGEELYNKTGLCIKCFKKLNFITSPKCDICGYPFEIDMSEDKNLICPNCLKKNFKFNKARSVFTYNDITKKLILAYKHSRHIELAPFFSKIMLQAGSELLKETDLIIPVPISKLRLIKRGYNQSSLLAKHIGKHKKIKVSFNNLIRYKHTAYQGNMHIKQRRENVRNAFVIKNANKIRNKNILLIDDVFTTGATINECIKTLKKAGANKVFALTIARTVK